MMLIYPACFYLDNDGYTVVFPDLNCLSTDGKTLEQAMEHAIDCLARYLYLETKENHKLPKPTTLNNVDPNKIEKEMHFNIKSKESFTNLISVDLDSYAKEHFEVAIKKTLTIPAWLNMLAIQNNINFSKVLQEALENKLRGKIYENKFEKKIISNH